MGFKFKKFTIVGGSEELPVGTTSALLRQKSETLLKKIVQAIIDTNTGWALDSRTPTITSFLEVPDSGSTAGYWPGLLLYNSNSGCKLFAAYIGNNGIKNFSGNDTVRAYSDWASLCLSMIPAGSANNFGTTFDSSFIPSDATRIIGCAASSYNTARNAASGTYYTYGIFANDSLIGLSADTGNNSTTPKLFVGKIFDTLLHESDNYKYGSFMIRLSPASGSATDASGSIIYFTTSTQWASTNLKSLGSSHPSYSTSYNSACIRKADGTWIDSDGSTYCVKMTVEGIEQLSPYVNATNAGKSRWIPYVVGITAVDIDTYGVVPGDGMKGYLDTDLFRCAIGTYGQQFDNGNFICIDADNNFLIGWDPDNDPLVGE